MFSFILLSMLIGCGDSGPKGKPAPPPKPIRIDEAKAAKTKGDTKSEHKGHAHAANAKPIDVGPIPENAKVHFISPKDGAKVKSPVKVQMGVKGMTVEPASNGINANKGHHHIIIDTPSPAKGIAIPKDEKHQHYGKGQTETELKLQPGKHTLRLQFANGAHISYGSKMSAEITITVEP